jgi:hypothetical protein
VQQRSTTDPGSTRTIVYVGKITFGLIFILAAIWGLRRRPWGGEDVGSRRWIQLVNEGGVVRSFGLGLFLADFSLKNLALVAAAASVIGQASLGTRGMAIAVGIFVLICTIGILVPLLVRVFGKERGDRLLANWGEWLERNVAMITAVVMVFLGAHLILQGIGGLM